MAIKILLVGGTQMSFWNPNVLFASRDAHSMVWSNLKALEQMVSNY